MKAILVIDVPDGIDLERYRAYGIVKQIIFDSEDLEKMMYSTPIEFNFCSLQPMPQRKNEEIVIKGHTGEIAEAYQDGWNACLDALGETE